MPGHTRASLSATLDRLLALEPDHLSAYGLTLEPGTVFGARAARGELAPAPDDAYLAADAIVEAAAERAGLRRYEISNYARPGRECAHNLAIWRGGFYAGLGPSAASTLPGGAFGRRRANVADLAAYIQKDARRRGQLPPKSSSTAGPQSRPSSSAPSRRGSSLTHFAARFGTPLASPSCPRLAAAHRSRFSPSAGSSAVTAARPRDLGLDSRRLAGALDGDGA